MTEDKQTPRGRKEWTPEEWWHMLLTGDGLAIPLRESRYILSMIPGHRRCKFCNAPFDGAFAPILRVMGKGPSGNVVTVGGWGRVLGDEGSGYHIGLDAIKAVTRDFDGLSEAGALMRGLKERFGLESRQGIINAVYRHRFDIPSVAPLVLAAADAGDGVAVSILRRAATDLAGQISGAIRRLRPLPGRSLQRPG